MSTTPDEKWQECLDHFAPVTGQPPTGPDQEEFLQLRKVADQIGTPCAVLLGRETQGLPVPSDVLNGLASIIESFEQRVATLHAKLPKTASAPGVEGAQ
ncbi:MAG: hypothetical protein PHO20_04155 [Candidatus Peribacteraceae bacterium]|nr:hypothetical protein [Candidatus Peribacteraceae bacterium]MDD5739933.1 hypothetical protein [Candidatus Peribacteraceae bacterium]